MAQRASSRPSLASSKRTSSFVSTLFFCAVLIVQQGDTNKLFEQYDVQDHIDELHGVVTGARTRRRQAEPPSADRWREDLQPREAVRARTNPTLEEQRDMLRARLAQVRDPLPSSAHEARSVRRRRRKTWSCTVSCRRAWRHRNGRMPRPRRSWLFSTRFVCLNSAPAVLSNC